MKTNILLENMKRFKTKNLNEQETSTSSDYSLKYVVDQIHQDASNGRDVTDNISDELQDFSDAVYDGKDKKLVQLFSNLRDTMDTNPRRQESAAKQLLNYINQQNIDLPYQRTSTSTSSNFDQLLQIISKYVKDYDEAESAVERYLSSGESSLDNALLANLSRDPEWQQATNR